MANLALESPTKKAAIFEEKEKFFDKYRSFLKDEILGQIYSTIEDNWDELNNQAKKQLLNLFEKLIESLIDYHETYKNLKAASKRKFYFEDIKDFQESVKNADIRERIAHNNFIDSINILSRKMKSLGLDNSWRGKEKIYGLSKEETIEKTRNWMLEIFGEK